MKTREEQLAAAWEQIRDGLGDPFGEHLESTREFIGDRAFLRLASEFEPVHVIIACGIQIAAELLGGMPNSAAEEDAEDEALRNAVSKARSAHLKLTERQ